MLYPRITVTIAILSLLLAACGGDGTEPTATAPRAAVATATNPPSATATSTAAPLHEIVFAGALADGHNRVYCVDADGSDLHPLTPFEFRPWDTEVYEGYPVFSPDGNRIAYMRYGDVDVEGVWIINVDGTGEQRVARGWARDLAWSPDGNQLAFAWLQWGWPPYERGQGVGAEGNPVQLIIVNADGTDLHKLSDPALTAGPVTDILPVWSPDGAQILFQRWTHAGEAAEDTIELWLANADGSGLRPLDTGAVGVLLTGWAVTWSPDGTRLAFAGGTEEPIALGVYTMRPDGSDLRRLGDVPALGPIAWSPDGTRLAFPSTTAKLRPPDDWSRADVDLYTMAADGSDLRLVLDLPNTREESPAWSPDGTRLLYTSAPTSWSGESPPPVALGVVGIDGSNPVTLVAELAGRWEAQSGPMWRPITPDAHASVATSSARRSRDSAAPDSMPDRITMSRTSFEE